MSGGKRVLTETTTIVIQRLFASADHRRRRRGLANKCGVNLPLTAAWGDAEFERVWFAVLKLSGGDVSKLHEAVGHAQRDWRDVLVWSGFGHSLEAHHQWARTIASQ